MEEMMFINYLNQKYLRNARVKRIIKSVKRFEIYLLDVKKDLDTVEPDDLDYFLNDYYAKYVSEYYIGDLKYYYSFVNNKNMKNAVEKMIYKYTPPFNLSKLKNVKTENIIKLNEEGITTNIQMLNICKTDEERMNLSRKINIPIDDIIVITKMSDLTRISAVKSIRAQLYYEAGIDTVKKIADLEPSKLREIVVRYVEESDFDGIPTLPKEAEATIKYAKNLPTIIDL